MPTYTWVCTICDIHFDQSLTFKEYDRVKEKGDNQLTIKCPECLQHHTVKRSYEGYTPAISFGPGFFKDGYQSAKNVKRKEE